jgi:YbgC/YbaW family acyl-CoA thioester hydrolase
VGVHEHVVHFSETDPAGILFFSRVFEICHHAFEAFLAERGFPLARVLTDVDWILPLVHAEADFQAPIRLGETLQVEVAVERLGAGSITFAFALTIADRGPVATVRHVHAAIDRATWRPRKLPDEVRTHLGPG